MKHRRTKVVLIVAGTCVLLATASVVGIKASLPDGFNLAAIREQIRRHDPKLFSKIKSTIITNDKDVAAIGVTRKLPLFRLVLTRKDVAHFSELYRKYENPDHGVASYAKHNRWRKAVLKHDGQTYDVKIKSHGRAPTLHRNGKHISLAIKLPKGKQINHARRFGLLIRDHFKPEKQLVYDLARRFGVLANEEQLVRVAINNWDEKLYFFDRRLGDAYMEANRRPSLRLFGYALSPTKSTVKSSIHTHEDGPFDPEAFRKRFLRTAQELGYPASHHAPLCDHYLGINQAIVDGTAPDVNRYFDIDYLSSFEAVRLIAGMHGHFAMRTNLYVFCNTANGKFYPVFTRDCNMAALRVADNETVEQQINQYRDQPLPMFRLISKNDRVRQDAYRKAYRFISSEQEAVNKRHREIRESYEKLSYYGWCLVTLRRLGRYKENISDHNMTVLKSYLERLDAELIIWTDQNRLVIEMTPQSMAAIRIDRLAINLVPTLSAKDPLVRLRVVANVGDQLVTLADSQHLVRPDGGRIDLTHVVGGMEFCHTLDAQSRRVNRKYTLMLTFENLTPLPLTSQDVTIELANAVTGKQFGDAGAKRRSGPAGDVVASSPPPEDAFLSWQRRHPGLRITRTDQGELILHRGSYTLEEDLLVPMDLKLVIEAGTTLRLGENVALVGFRGLDVRGTASEPVTITSIKPDKPFGSVGILGDQNTKSTIRYLHLSNGYERWSQGVYFSVLSLHYNGEVHISDSTIARNHADDGLNIKYGKVLIKRCLFQDNAADQVDIDLCSGSVLDSRFVTQQLTDANGDGLDVSGSEIVVRDCHFNGFTDKGVSIGEQSRVLCYQNVFRSNRVAAAVKDLSNAYLVNNAFVDNMMDVDAYQKKSIFGGGHVYLGTPPTRDAAIQIYLDQSSTVRVCPDTAALTTLVRSGLTGNVPEALKAVAQSPWVQAEATVKSKPWWRPNN